VPPLHVITGWLGGTPAGRAVTFAAVFTLLAHGLWTTPAPQYVALLVVGIAAALTWETVKQNRLLTGAASGVLAAVFSYWAIKVQWGTPDGLMLWGACLGALYGLMAVGIILIYRANRIINFAAGSMGALPAVFALTLMTVHGLSYWLVLPLAIAGGALIGGLIDLVIVRRFATAPRLILTVVTVGAAQLLAFFTLLTPGWLGADRLPDVIRTPLTRFGVFYGRQPITGDQFLALGGVVLCAVLLGAFFKYTRMGIAVRASAENADRASLLGIPVRRVGTVAWALAGTFSAITVFLRAPIVGLPLGGLAGAEVLLFALAAAVIARMDRLPVAIGAGMVIGAVDQSSVFATGRSSEGAAVMLIIIVVALLVQRGAMSRAHDTGVSTWQAVKELRAVPPELRSAREVVIGRTVVIAGVAAFFLFAPWIVGDANISFATGALITGMVGVSLVILTGWAGQISLGQFAFVGVGALTAGHLVANHDQDLFVVLVAGGLAGAVVAILVGIPALRIQGLFLAVTTLAFAAFTQFWLLNRSYPLAERMLPSDGARVMRPMLFQRIDLTDPRAYYWFCLVFLVLTLAAATAFRRNRSGRVLIAARDNPRAASSYSVNLARTKLAAFAVAGFIAAVAGVLNAYELGAIDAGTYGAGASIAVFAYTVVGGISSLVGGVLAGVLAQGVNIAASRLNLRELNLLVTGPGLIVILMFLPGGIAEGLWRTRDTFLRWVAKRNDIHVPSLVADRRIESGEDEQDIVTEAEHRVEAAESFVVVGATLIRCPVCEADVALDDAPDHEHLRREPVAATPGEPR
jgi:branched-chain amino acid transport system permease protein